MRPITPRLAPLAAVVLVACTSSAGDGATFTPSVSTPLEPATSTAMASPAESATATVSPQETTSDRASPAPGPLGDADECENPELGYRVGYPGDWWANERVEPEDDNLTPIPACEYFAPSEVELQPNAGLPNGIAIRFELAEVLIDPPQEEIRDDRATTVDGHDARILETEPAPQPGFVPEGSRVYRYLIEVDDGRRLVATTDNILQDDAAYEASKDVLDAMMETLQIEN
jgi:hypothetical protein